MGSAPDDGHDGDARLERQIAFVLEIDKLKQVFRQTPLIDGSRHENDAEHSWQLALMAVLLAEYSDAPVDLLRVVKMLLVHDLVEIDAGDTFLYDAVAARDQAERERKAADRIFGLLPGDQARELRGLWDEFEARESADARFARAIDRLQPLLHNFHSGGGTWGRPGVNADLVRQRKLIIGDASQQLWRHAQALIDAGVARGYLAAEADPG